MARIRTIKPEFWTSSQIVECSTTARLLFIGIWNFADDRGVIPANPKEIKMKVLPGDDLTSAEISLLLSELEQQQLLRRFNSDGTDYYIITGWKHQKIEKPSYKYPEPKFDDYSTTIRLPLSDCPPAERKGKDSIVEDSIGRDSIKPKGDEKSSGKKDDFFSLILNIFKDCYKESRGVEYYVSNHGKENAAISKLIQIYKAERPDSNTTQTLIDFEVMFKQCLSINDKWLYESMSIPIIVSQFNKIRIHFKTSNNGQSAITDEELDNIISEQFAAIPKPN